MRLAYVIFCFVVGASVAFFYKPYVGDNSDVLTVVTTTTTVFAGFLVAIITVIGDPSMAPSGSWRAAEAKRNGVEQRVVSYINLFILYMMTIASVFLSAAVKKVPHNVMSDEVKEWFDFFYLFLGISAFLLSLTLPFGLLKIQMERLDGEIDRRRRQEGIDKP